LLNLVCRVILVGPARSPPTTVSRSLLRYQTYDVTVKSMVGLVVTPLVLGKRIDSMAAQGRRVALATKYCWRLPNMCLSSLWRPFAAPVYNNNNIDGGWMDGWMGKDVTVRQNF
jgi:hypothetical protein